MSYNQAPLTGEERHFSDHEFIISMTDTKGILTYANDIFLNIADYTESEVLGQPHNILRHPDMPACIFQFLWDTIQSGEEVLAYVVNKTKHGDHYWVFAHITPTRDENDKIVGYLSSRRTATKQALSTIMPLYKQLKAEEDKHTRKKDGIKASMALLTDTLKSQNTTYGEFILGV